MPNYNNPKDNKTAQKSNQSNAERGTPAKSGTSSSTSKTSNANPNQSKVRWSPEKPMNQDKNT